MPWLQLVAGCRVQEAARIHYNLNEHKCRPTDLKRMITNESNKSITFGCTGLPKLFMVSQNIKMIQIRARHVFLDLVCACEEELKYNERLSKSICIQCTSIEASKCITTDCTE